MKRTLFLLSALAGLASLLGLAAVIHQHRVQTFGVVNGLPDPALDDRPASLRAVNVSLEQYAGIDEVLDSLSAFEWLRQTFAWDEIEPARGEYHWEKWDAIVSAASAHQKEIIAVLSDSPAWANQAPNPRAAPPASPADFAAFASAFAARYADSINVYQIWDEPNLLTGWGGRPPSASAYAALLQAAYSAIHAADPHATVIAAALAPTVEAGPENVSDLLYLQQLYDLGAGEYFDAAAGKPYGFYTGPDDRLADPAVLNFSRFALLRQVMEKNGDGHKLLWGGNFGWNRTDSPWGKATPQLQIEYTLAAYERAEREWPWAGPLALENYQPPLSSEENPRPPDDPRWGFALADPAGHPTPLLQTLNSNSNPGAVPGNYPARHPSARYSGAWEFSGLGADIPEDFSNAHLEITFTGTDLALKVRRGDYRGYLYVTIDGQPANRLPRDGRGAYLVLTSPDLQPQVVTLPVASGLDPNRPHVALIQPGRGWDQWALAGFSVGRRTPMTHYLIALGALLAMALIGGIGLWRFGRGSSVAPRLQTAWHGLGATGQLVLAAVVGVLLYLSSWLTFRDDVMAISRRFGDALPLVVTALTAGLFYFSPSALLALAALAALFVLFYLRLDLALAFVAAFIPFYLFPRLLWTRGASMVEITLWLALAAWLAHNFRPLLLALQLKLRLPPQASRLHPAKQSLILHPSSLDLALLAFVLVGLASALLAERRDVALYEFRAVILDSALYYLLLRAVPLDRKATWRIVDFFLLGAVAVAAYGLFQFFTGTGLIAAEGVARIRSVYGSPNNLALYIGRALPVALAVALLGAASGLRRGFYALAALLLGLTILLTFSKGALFLGLPAALALIVIFWLGRRGAAAVGGAALGGAAALPLLSRVPRFAGLLNPESGTSFFRTKLWLSAWRMFLDHPLLGVGPDNFLYQYRSFYILPEAWQDPNLSHPHNLALDHLSRLGLLGFVCGVWLHVGFWRVAVDAYRRLRQMDRELSALCVGLMASMADMLAHGLVDHAFFLIDLALVFGLTLGLAHRLQRFAREDL